MLRSQGSPSFHINTYIYIYIYIYIVKLTQYISINITMASRIPSSKIKFSGQLS
jgi:hypothetical protein